MSFFLPGAAPDEGYRNVRDLDNLKHLRDFVEGLWAECQHLADRHFRQDAKAHFQERFWEMYLAVALLQRGYEVQPAGDNSPDLRVMDGDNPIYVEATAPGPGDGPDAVPESPLGVASRVPEDQIILRLRAAIEAKLKQHERWLSQGVIDGSSPYIVAVNGRRVRQALVEGTLPFIVKAVFPFGDYSVVLDLNADEITDGFHAHRDTIRKTSGSAVKTDLFESDAYNPISAVLYANCDCANHADNFGDEFTLVHNPRARNPLRHGFFPFGREYTSDDEFLHRKDWNAEESA